MLLPGEIASTLPDELRDRYPDVAWRQIRAYRNLAVHKYFGVDWAVVWKIAQEEPPLLEVNAIHPFREGNGRAQRAFLSSFPVMSASSSTGSISTRPQHRSVPRHHARGPNTDEKDARRTRQRMLTLLDATSASHTGLPRRTVAQNHDAKVELPLSAAGPHL
jgi:hypothetical protein